MKIYTTDEKFLISKLHGKAQNFLDKQNFTEAIRCYNQILILNKKDKYAWVKQGNIFALLNFKETARECYERALQIDPYYNYAINCKRMISLELFNSSYQLTQKR